MPKSIRVVGSGLIGTSIALALKSQGVACQMVDIDFSAADLASDLVGGVEIINPDVVVLALPSSRIALVIEQEYALNPNSIFMDVGSVKTEVIQEIERSSLPLSQFVPTHPMAGREIGGAHSARADLFVARSWVLTPTSECDPQALAVVSHMIESMGASPVTLSAQEHDRAVAAISHLPQIASSLLARSLRSTPSNWLDLAGAGLRDTTRIAGSDPSLWSEIIFANRAPIEVLVRALHKDLSDFIEHLNDKESISAFIDGGRVGRSQIPGKHGGKPREYSYLPIVIEDKPGQLAAIFDECAQIAVNVEDLAIEHSPGQLSALITLALSANDAELLSQHLSTIGWNVHPILK